MKTSIVPCTFLVLLSFSLSGCMTIGASLSQKHPIVNSIYVSGATVYAAGFRAQGRETVARFWKDGTRTDLPGEGGIARSIFVSGNTVYVAGSLKDVACLWVNGVRRNLPGGGGSAASVLVSGDAVYAAGFTVQGLGLFERTVACYWVNGARTDLANFAFASSIAVSDNTIYTSGSKDGLACYWANGERKDLPCNGRPRFQSGASICVSENTVYVAGWYNVQTTFESRMIACSWTNGVRTDLPGSEAFATSVSVHDHEVYVAGSYGNKNVSEAIPCYWKNGERIDLPGGMGWASSIFVSEGTVYVAGHVRDAACCWINGQELALP